MNGPDAVLSRKRVKTSIPPARCQHGSSATCTGKSSESAGVRALCALVREWKFVTWPC